MTYILPIGSISHGTLRSPDLAEALLPLAEAAGLDTGELGVIASDEGDSDDAPEIISETIDALNEHAPPFCYLGMHEGDGADLGVWLDWDAIENAIHDGDVLKISDLADLDDLATDNREYEYALCVNDHGDTSLFPLRLAAGDPVWGVV